MDLCVMVCGTEEWVTGNNSCVAAGWFGVEGWCTCLGWVVT